MHECPDCGQAFEGEKIRVAIRERRPGVFRWEAWWQIRPRARWALLASGDEYSARFATERAAAAVGSR